MKRIVLLLIVLAPAASLVHAACGYPPITPIPPVGKHECHPICICDSTGYSCHYEFECT